MSSPAESRRPDVVFITVDQWRGDQMPGAAGAWIAAPNLAALAAEGTSFRQHYTQAYPCGPARAGLLTGLYPHKHRSIQNGTPLDARHRTLFQAARGVGYAPVLFGYTDTTPDPRGLAAADPAIGKYTGPAAGLDIGCFLDDDARVWIADLLAKGYKIPQPSKGRDGVFAQSDFGAPAIFSAADSETAFLTDQVLGHLATQSDAPFFMHISYISPHPPFTATQDWLDAVNPTDIPPPQIGPHQGTDHPLEAALRFKSDLSGFVPGLSGRTDQAPHAVIATIRHAYAALAAEVDHHIGRIIARLKAMGRWENTLFVFCGDHGEMLFEHGLLGKLGWYDDAAHVPLIIRAPGAAQAGAAQAGAVVEDFTQSIDIYQTFVDALGLAPDANLDGESLMPFARGMRPQAWRDRVFWSFDFRNLRDRQAERHFGLPSKLCNLHVMRSARLKYVHSVGLPPLLFDLERDPQQQINLYGDPSARDLQVEGVSALLELRLRHEEESLSQYQAIDGKLWRDQLG